MTDHVWVGGARAVAQVSKITLPTDIDAGQVFNATIGRKTLSYTFITGETRLTAAAAIVSAWNLSDIPEFAEVTASNNGDGSFNLTADEEGIPFIVTTQIGSSTNEVQVITVSGATGGTFTLTYDGQTTGNIAYNASAGTVDTALEALSNIGSGDVSVTGSAGGPWTVEFTGSLAATNVAPMTASGSSLTGGTPEEQTITLINSPSGGTFTLDFNGEVTGSIAYNADAATVESALEALPGIKPGDVSVTGSAGGPWTVEFTDDLEKDVPLMTAESDLTAPSVAVAPTLGGESLGVSNLVSYWTLDEASGTRIDSRGSRNLSDNNTVTSATGVQSNGAVFDNANDEYLSYLVPEGDDLYFDDNASFSISLWVKFTTVSGTIWVFGMDGTGSTSGLYTLYSTGARLTFAMQDASSTDIKTVAVDSDIEDDTWYMVTCAYDSTAGVIKIKLNDGDYVTTAYSGGVRTPDSYPNLFTVGKNGIQYFDGSIDEFSIWNKVLDDDETAVIYNNGGGITAPSINGTNEIQTLSFSGSPTAGNVGVSFRGSEALIPYDSTAAEAEALLEALDTIGTGNIDVTGGDWPGTALVVEFINELGTSSQPLFTVNNTPAHILMAETVKGDLLSIDVQTTGGPIDVTTVTANSGPNDWNTAANWNTETVPTGSDNVFIVDGDNILYGLDQSGVTFGTIQIYNSETEIGLPRRNDDYYEYRTRFLTIGGATTIIIGLGEGNGSDRINLDIGTSSPNITVYNSGSGDGGETAVQIVGENSSNTAELLVLAGEVGIALFPDDAAYFNKLTQRNGSLRLGQDITVKELIVTGGSITSDRTTLDGATTL